MKTRRCPMTFLIGFMTLLMPVGFSAIANFASGAQSGAGDDQAYAGRWAGTYASDGGGSGNVTYTFSKDEKGQWRGTVKYTNQDGEHTAELREFAITGAKFKAKIAGPDSDVEITLEGEFKGTELTGTYSVLEKSSKEVAEKGTWKTTKS